MGTNSGPNSTVQFCPSAVPLPSYEVRVKPSSLNDTLPSLALLVGLCGAQAEDTCVFSEAVPSRLFFQCPGEGGRGDAPRDGRLPHLRVAERRLAGHHLDRLVPLDKCARVVPQEPSARRHGGNLWDPFLRRPLHRPGEHHYINWH